MAYRYKTVIITIIFFCLCLLVILTLSSSSVTSVMSSVTSVKSSVMSSVTSVKSSVMSVKSSVMSVTSVKSATPPNIVFIMADDYGWNDIGYHGSEIETPQLDALADSGIKLENYYVQHMCTPTRSQLMTGRYQIHTGLSHSVIFPWQDNGLPVDSPTLPDKMREAGYATHMVGKWHLGLSREKHLPLNKGFDTFYGFYCGGGDYYTHEREYEGKWYLDLRDNDDIVRTENGTYSTHLFTDKAVDVVKSHAANSAKPLFLYLSYQSVHRPLQVPEKYTQKYKFIKDKNRRLYAGMVAVLDEGIKNLTDALKETGLWDNTVLVFSTDNGGLVTHGANNYPLRGWKRSLWEGGIRAVGFVAGGAVKTSGVINRELVHVSDWYPTLVGLAGGQLNGTKPLDGFDQWQTIVNGFPSQRYILLHNIDILHPRKGKPRYNNTWDTSVRAAIRVGDYKLITGNPGTGSWVDDHGKYKPAPKQYAKKNVWLFNIKDDPNEVHDLSQVKPDIVRNLLDMIKSFNDTAVPPRFPEKDPRCDPARHGGVWGPWL